MSPYRLLMPVAACLVLTAGPVVATEPEASPAENEISWHVSARDIPLPRAASPVFRENLGRHDAPDKARVMSQVPADPDQWREAIAAEDARIATAVQAEISRHKVTVEAIELDGVAAYHLVPRKLDPAKDQAYEHVIKPIFSATCACQPFSCSLVSTISLPDPISHSCFFLFSLAAAASLIASRAPASFSFQVI